MFTGNYSTVAKEVVVHINAGNTAYISGRPGHGKSALARMIAKETGKKIVEIDAMLFDPTDFLSQIPNRETKKMETWAGPMLPNPDDAKNTILLIDDLPHAKPFQQTPMLQLIFDKRMGAIRFPGLSVIITGNREEDNAEINPTPSPLLNRTSHYDLVQSVDDWLNNFAIEKGFHPAVIGFLASFPTEFSSIPEPGQRTWNTPRTWELLSKALKEADRQAGGECTEVQIKDLAVSLVGQALGSKIYGWAKYIRNDTTQKLMTQPEDLIKPGTGKDRLYAYAAVLGNQMRKHFEESPSEFSQKAPAFGRALNLLSPEYRRISLIYLRSFPLSTVAMKREPSMAKMYEEMNNMLKNKVAA